MNTVDRVKELCKANGIPIYKLEQQLGFANGYIGQLKKGSFPDDRLEKIADFFGVSIEYLLTGESSEYYVNPETAEMAQQIFENPDLRLLFDVAKDVTPEQLKLLHDLALSWKVSND